LESDAEEEYMNNFRDPLTDYFFLLAKMSHWIERYSSYNPEDVDMRLARKNVQEQISAVEIFVEGWREENI